MHSCVKLLLLALLLAGAALFVVEPLPAQNFSVLHNFSGGSDGAQPFAGLTLASNTLYGTTLLGGNLSEGTAFSLQGDGAGFQTLYSFDRFNDGFYPQGVLTDLDTALFGTAHFGGPANNGTVFTLNNDGTGFKTLHVFSVVTGSLPYQTNSDGANPQAGLLLSAGTLFGTAAFGGSGGYGTVFSVNTDGTGFRTLHHFSVLASSAQTNRDGATPYAGLCVAGDALYGAAFSGGAFGRGTIFTLKTDGSGFKTLHSFSGTNDGGDPLGGLVSSSNVLYGTTLQGGSLGRGTLFAINSDGTGFRTLHNFAGTADGANPGADLLLSGNTLYGTATYGGTFNSGTIFAVQTGGTVFTNLYSFTAASGSPATNSDGANPSARLTFSNNTLYGTAKAGGSLGQGTVFRLLLGPIKAPVLTIARSGPNVILSWPAGTSGFNLQSATNLAAPVWTSVFPGPVLVNGLNTVTNPLSAPQRFYRLMN